MAKASIVVRIGLFAVWIGVSAIACSPSYPGEGVLTPERSIMHVSVEDSTSESSGIIESHPAVSVQYDGIIAPPSSACEKLISEGPAFEDGKAQMAFALYREGRYAEALKAFEEAISKTHFDDEERQKIAFLKAMALAKSSGNLDDAVSQFKVSYGINGPLRRISALEGVKLGFGLTRWQDILDMTEVSQTNDTFRTYRGIALTNLGQYDAALAEFEAVKAYPKNLRLSALNAKARAQAETTLLRESLETYRRIYEIDPKSEQGQMAQEAILAQREKWPKGFVFPRVEAKVDRSKSEREVAQAHFDAHRSEKAIAAFSKLLKSDKARRDKSRVCDDLYAIARSHVKLREHAKSLPVFKEALETCSDGDRHIKVLYSAAKAAWNAGENDRALAWYQELIEGYPEHSYADDAYHYQAQILLSLKRDDEARTKLEEQIKRYPDGDMAKDAYWLLLSDLYDRAMWREAVAFVDANIAHAGESDFYTQGRLKYFQARAYEHLGKDTSAMQSYLTILDAYPLSYYAMLSLGRLEVLDKTQAKEWLSVYRPTVYRPEQAMDYCFQTIENEDSFRAAKSLIQFGLLDEALNEIDVLQDNSDVHVSYEAKLARAIILQKLGRYSDSARLASGLLRPVQDFAQHAYAAWLLAYPKPWEAIVSKNAKGDKTLYYTAYAIMREESYYNPNAESWANARGLMQLMLPTAQSSASDIGLPKPSARDLFKPETNIPIGMAYIDKLYHILIPHPMFVLPGYNAGQGNVGKWIKRFADFDTDVYVEKIPFKEARHYAKRVGMTLWRYRWLYDDDMPNLFDPALSVSSLSK